MKVHRLKFINTAYFGPNDVLEYSDDKVYATNHHVIGSESLIKNYKHYPKTREYIKVTKPSTYEWKAFYEGLKKINIENWNKKYEDDLGILDGNTWEFSVRIGNINKATLGYASFPDNEVGISNPFDRLYELLNDLSGGVFINS